MFVTKRKGTVQEIDFEKINNRIKYITNDPTELSHIKTSQLAQTVIQSLYDGMNTSDIDNYTANIAASLSIEHRDYNILASRIVINNCHKNTLCGFKDKMNLLYLRTDKNGQICPLISDEFYKFIEKNQIFIEKNIDYSRDYLIDFFGYRTLEKGYLLKIDSNIIERPQDLFMRVSVFMHMNTTDYKSDKSLEKILETYNLMSQKYFIHATPTLFNAGTIRPALASCFLLGTEDSLEGIMKTATDCANISKWAGGIGFHFSNVRGEDALIRKTNGKSSGTIPFLRIFNDVARAFNQGGKRLGSFAAYLEPHHPDIINFLNLRRNNGDENLRTRDLFLALWISDLFMERVRDNSVWHTFDPDECPGLNEVYGDEYKELYMKYENDKKHIGVYNAREIWQSIFTSQKESGLPYMLYKDNVNNHNNQSNMGIIKSSNLCCEITIYSDSKEFGTCHLSSICLPKFVEDSYSDIELLLPELDRRILNDEFPVNPIMNWNYLAHIAGVVCRNLNNVIDRNYYTCPEAKISSMRGRPIGIGVQGLADVFYKFKTPFDSELARKLNKMIFEAIQFGALSASSELAKSLYKDIKSGKPKQSSIKYLDTRIGSYPAYLINGGSPLSNNKFHWELYGLSENDLSGKFDWKTLRDHIMKYGVRNSLLTALMPTASTSQLNGNIECFEPVTSNMYKRKVLSGEFIIINKYMSRDLNNMGLWDNNMINYLKLSGGSVQNIDGLSSEFKQLYRTVWEISQKSIMEMAIDRQPFVDQAQSMNLFFKDFTFDKFSSAQLFAWENKLKTGSYYIRTQASVSPQKFTVNPKDELLLKDFKINTTDNLITTNDDEICLLCSS
jgi:ribonucleoside-diphosphate reductase alpha chain